MTDLEAFIDGALGNGYCRKWLFEDYLKVYVRTGLRMVGSESVVSFEIANIEVDPSWRRQGLFKHFVHRAARHMHERAPRSHIFIENVLNEHLTAYLRRNDWHPRMGLSDTQSNTWNKATKELT